MITIAPAVSVNKRLQDNELLQKQKYLIINKI